MALVATDDTITGLSLYVTPYSMADADAAVLVGDLALLLTGWFLCRRALAR